MAPGYGSDKRLSRLTLAVLSESGWYTVDNEKAEPLVISRPSENGCDVVTKSCHEILGNIQKSGKNTDVKFPAPYCDYENVISVSMKLLLAFFVLTPEKNICIL